MPGGKDNKPKPIAEKYALDYYRQPLSTRRWKPSWFYSALAFAVATMAGVYLLQRNAIFQAAPVSAVHASFGNNCSACHEASWQPALRLATFNAAHRSVPDTACRECHQAADHVPGLMPAEHCASCHQEHRPEGDLMAIADGHCLKCHAQLTLPHGAGVSFVTAIENFDAGTGGHPEFALLRDSDADIGERHAATTLATLTDGRWRDRGGLRGFDHKDHLNPDGVKVPEQNGGAAEDGPSRGIEKLTCANCHEPDDNGRMMKPIVFEQHCQRCHPLELSEELGGLGEAPHGPVDEVYGLLRRAKLDQLNRRAAANESQPLQNATKPRDAVKTRLPKQALLTPEQEEKLHREADRLVFRKEADPVVFDREAKRMCAGCHFMAASGTTWEVLAESPDVVGAANARTTEVHPIMPVRWMPHANFDHRAHRAVACSECHAAAESEDTADILLPSIDTCRKCHGGEGDMATGRVGGECVLCHTYHGAATASGGKTLDFLFNATHRSLQGSRDDE